MMRAGEHYGTAIVGPYEQKRSDRMINASGELRDRLVRSGFVSAVIADDDKGAGADRMPRQTRGLFVPQFFH